MDSAMRSIRGKIRERDEDSICMITSTTESEVEHRNKFFCALADGMGGAPRGDLASKLAVNEARHIGAYMIEHDLTPADIMGSFKRIYENANSALLNYVNRNGMAKMGTTLVTAFFDGNELYVGNIGDSRLYIFNKEGNRFRTADHSYVQLLVDQGILTEEEAKYHPRKNEIMRVLGFEEDPTPDMYRLRVFKRDSILLCCDGLWEAYDDALMASALNTTLSCYETLDIMIDRANEVDGSDNISAILVRPYSEVSEESALKRPTKSISNL